MGRLIDADALYQAMYNEAFESDSELQKWDSGCWIRFKMFEKHLDNAPTIEVERPTGKWIAKDLTWGRSMYMCNACGIGMDVPTICGEVLYCYCPRCGAKMEISDEHDK